MAGAGLSPISPARVAVLAEVAEQVLVRRRSRPGLRVGIDGVDGSGKTMFADQLAGVLRSAGLEVVRVSADDFHRVREKRHARGATSPEGFWLDSYDYPRLVAEVLAPLGPGGARRFRPRGHDLASDEVLLGPFEVAPEGAVLVLDGLFLHRDELAGCWDLTCFLDVPFEETARRMAVRDGTAADPLSPSMRRYVEAQQIYLAACDPRGRADLLVDNSDWAAPKIRRRPPDSP